MKPVSPGRTETDLPAGAAPHRRRLPGVQTALATGVSLLVLPILLLVLPQLSLHGNRADGARRRSAPATVHAPAADGALPGAQRATATRTVPRPALSPPQTASPVVANMDEARQVCAGTLHEDALGQPIVLPVQSVIVVGPTYWDAAHPPPLVSCQVF